MLIEHERQKLLDQNVLKTDVSRRLYEDYYHLLFEFANDLKNSNVEEISIKDGTVVLTTRREGIRLNCLEGERTSALGQLILAGTESEDQDMLVGLMGKIVAQKNDNAAQTIFFDIGANIGWYSILFGRLFSGLQIHAFEPIDTTFGQLLINLSLNSVDGVHTNQIGFSDKAGTFDFYVSPTLLAASSLADTFKTDDKLVKQARTQRLDDYCHHTGVYPDLIKCDVEGAELLVFQGGLKTLDRSRPIVMAELLRKWSSCFGYHPNDVIDLFAKHGYGCYVTNGSELKTFARVADDTRETNYFFIHHEESHKFI
jgi:FkbM family methyltransferase